MRFESDKMSGTLPRRSRRIFVDVENMLALILIRKSRR